MIELIGLWILTFSIEADLEAKAIIFTYLIFATGFRLTKHVAGGKRDE